MPRGYRLFCVGVGVGRQLFNFLPPGPPTDGTRFISKAASGI